MPTLFKQEFPSGEITENWIMRGGNIKTTVIDHDRDESAIVQVTCDEDDWYTSIDIMPNGPAEELRTHQTGSGLVWTEFHHENITRLGHHSHCKLDIPYSQIGEYTLWVTHFSSNYN